MKEIMTPEHPRWDEFIQRLEGPEGCNFKCDNDEKGELDPKTATWKCKGGTDKSLSRAILEKMGGINIEASLEYFESHGGYCDCEVIFNLGGMVLR